MFSETVPCPMCANGQSPGQLDRPVDGWPAKDIPHHLMSIPCPLCHGEGTIARKLWDEMSAANRTPVNTEKPKPKPKDKSKIELPAIWEEMKKLKHQVEEDWRDQGPFNISSYKKVD